MPYPREKPVDSLHQVKRYGLDISEFGSCSAPTNQGGEINNKGCPWWSVCRFAAYKTRRDENDQPLRDANGNVAGRPGYIGVDTILANGTSNGAIVPCYDYYWAGWAARAEVQHKSNETIAVVAFEGGKVKTKSTRAKHPQPVKGCQGCQKGSCVLRESYTETEVVPPWEGIELLVPDAVMAEERRTALREQAENDQLRVSLKMDQKPIEPVASTRL